MRFLVGTNCSFITSHINFHDLNFIQVYLHVGRLIYKSTVFLPMVIEIQTETWYLLWGIVIAIIVSLIVISIKFYKKSIDAHNQLDQRGIESRRLGINVTKGDYHEILGTFSLLNEYDDLIILSTTAGNASLDLIGVNKDSLDFIEIKTKGADLSKGEKKIRRLVEAKKVNYRIVDAELPSNFKTEDRQKPNNLKKK